MSGDEGAKRVVAGLSGGDGHRGWRKRYAHHARGFVWTGFDQALSSLSNVVVSVALARSGGAEPLGTFTVAFAAYLIAIGMIRSLVGEPLLTVPREPAKGADEPERLSTAVAGSFVLAASLVVTGIGLVLGQLEVTVVGLVLPGVAMQDFIRYLFFRRKRPELAALIDGVWVASSALGWPLIAANGSATVALLVWAVGGALGVLLGFTIGRVRMGPAVAGLGWWWREIRPLGGFLALDGLMFSLFSQISTLGLAAILGTAELGTLRGAQIIVGPVGLALTAFSVFVLPRLSAPGARQHSHLAIAASGGAGLVAAVASVGLWIGAPFFVPMLYGDQFEVPPILVFALGVRITVGALITGPALMLKARRRGAPIVIGRLAGAVIGVPLMLVTAALYGLVPAVWAGNAAALVNLAVLALALRSKAKVATKREAPGP